MSRVASAPASKHMLAFPCPPTTLPGRPSQDLPSSSDHSTTDLAVELAVLQLAATLPTRGDSHEGLFTMPASTSRHDVRIAPPSLHASEDSYTTEDDDDSLLFGSDGEEDEFVPTATTSSSMSRSNSELLDCLGRDAVSLLERLDLERAAERASHRLDTPRRVLCESSRSLDSLTWSPLAASPIAGPSTYQRTRRQKPVGVTSGMPLSDSRSTVREHVPASHSGRRREASFTKTDISQLDIEGILDAYVDFDAVLAASKLSSAEPRTPRAARQRASPRVRSSPRSRASPMAVRRQLVFPTASSPSSQRVDGHAVQRKASVADLPYNDLFPRHRVSPFPTRKKSTTSLATSHRSSLVPVPPPLPLGTFSASPILSTVVSSQHSSTVSPTRMRQLSIQSDSTSSRYSYQSSSASSEHDSSFRWSAASGSTAPTIAEDGESGSVRRGSLAYSSCGSVTSNSPELSRKSSTARSMRSNRSTRSAGTGRSRRAARDEDRSEDSGDLIDWTTFAGELLNAETYVAPKLDGDEQLRSRNVEQRLVNVLGDGEDESLETLSTPRSKMELSVPTVGNNGPFPVTSSKHQLHRAHSAKSTKSSSTTKSAEASLGVPVVASTLNKKRSLLSLKHLRSNATLRASAQAQAVPPVPALPNSRKLPVAVVV